MRNNLLIVPLLILLSGCAVISRFDKLSLESAISLKAESLELVSHGTEPSAIYANKIAALQSNLSAHVSYEKAKPKNQTSAKQWEILCSPDHLLGKFLKNWKAGYSKTFVEEEKSLISDGWDTIISLEGAKNHE